MKEERILVLREVEDFCYGVCFFMLREEKSAAIAAQAALLDLYRDEEFWRLSAGEREHRVCRLATARALERRVLH